MADVIRLKGVEKDYVTGDVVTRVLSDVNLGFEQGTFNSIIGASGSGKSTLLNIVGTLDRPTRGEVFVDGQSTARMRKNDLARLRNRTIGFVFQFHYLLPEFTARENVLMPYWIRYGKVSSEMRSKAEELLDMVGLSKVKGNLSTKMSGGQQQRTAIARALVNDPKVVLADEPTGNLDSENTENLYKLFRDINERIGTTFIVVTHDRRIAEKTDRIVEIRDGRITMDVSR
ncbi:MAG: ABC transporter ATP-binding protein [Thermoplasmata archaeon]|nr:ABC transporter ATP-binding protein [Thermoplasmata archaeon]